MSKKVIGTVVPAGGVGQRMNAGMPKQFLQFNNKPILVHTLELILSIGQIKEIIVVCPKDNIVDTEKILQEFSLKDKIKEIVCGGARRQDSVKNGVLKLSEEIEYVLIHDSVRPFVSKVCITNMINELDNNDCVVLGRQCTSTMKKVNEKNNVIETLDRDFIYEVQTPQIFKKEILVSCYDKLGFQKIKYTDEAMMVEEFGYNVKIVEGNIENIKITTPYDLKIAEIINENRDRI